MLRGRRRRQTLCILIRDDKIPAGKISINQCSRNNLLVHIGDIISIHPRENVPPGTSITVAPIQDALTNSDGSGQSLAASVLEATYLKPYFDDARRPVFEGNIFAITNGTRVVEFKIISTNPKPFCSVNKTTTVHCLAEPIKRERDAYLNSIGFKDIGGYHQQLATIKEIVELPLTQPSLFDAIGVNAPRGILLHGPPGTGKTLFARAVANETGAYFALINGPEIMNPWVGQSEAKVREAFENCAKNAPSILFIDEVDAISQKREQSNSEVGKRVVAMLLTLMDGLTPRDRTIVMAATNRPNSIDTALRRVGRFDQEVEFCAPNMDERLEILQIQTRKMRLDYTVNLNYIAAVTHGYVGSDLAGLCAEAGMQQLREKMNLVDLDDDVIDPAVLASLAITQTNFEAALDKISPSSLRENLVEHPDVEWQDIGGLESTKLELQEFIQYPIEHPEKFTKFGLKPTMGILLYGPPGCGKTLLARAIASQCNANFISVKGPELLSKWLGESESNVRNIFNKARGSAPCIVFFDEIDSIGAIRGSNGSNESSQTGAVDRVINQMLIELDGMDIKKMVFVIGATNRPQMIDTAMLRPGRLDQLIYVPLPDEDSRIQILLACLRKSPLAKDVDIPLMARLLDGFSAADLTGVCQRACKLAIRDCIAQERYRSNDQNNMEVDPVPEILWEHFLTAMQSARRSVTEEDLAVYKDFEQSMNGNGNINNRSNNNQ